MNDIIEIPTPITRELVVEDQEMGVAEDIFGDVFFLCLEPLIYEFADKLAPEYLGGIWRYYKLSNQGLYLAPEDDRIWVVSCPNGFHGQLSSDALGVTACLYAYSHCSFSRDERFGSKCSDHYHRLREFMYSHRELASILGAID